MTGMKHTQTALLFRRRRYGRHGGGGGHLGRLRGRARQAVSKAELVRVIRDAGRVPVELCTGWCGGVERAPGAAPRTQCRPHSPGGRGVTVRAPSATSSFPQLLSALYGLRAAVCTVTIR